MGKNKYIETPEKMWEYFMSYKSDLRSSPIQKTVKGNKNYILSDESLQRPLTLEGFENWLFENEILTDVSDYFENKDNRYSEYVPICRAIRRFIRQDQIEGGMVGIYNPSITQRLNGLVDKQEQAVNVSAADPETLKAIAARMNG